MNCSAKAKFKVLVFLNLLFIFNNYLFSAGPVEHYYLADRYIQICCPTFSVEDAKTFKDATLFPDIRYPAKISRSITHFGKVPLKVVASISDKFDAGMKFHSYVDSKRKRIVKDFIIKDPSMKKYQEDLIVKYSLSEMAAANFLKLVEDEILFENTNRCEAIDIVSKIHEGERGFGIAEKVLRGWHNYLTESFTVRSSKILSDLAAQDKPFLNYSIEVTKAWARCIKEAIADKNVRNLVDKIISEFEKEFTEFARNK